MASAVQDKPVQSKTMKLLSTSLLRCMIVIGTLVASSIQATPPKSTAGSDQPNDPGWPRERYQNGTRLTIYQPQVDDWKDFKELTWRMAVSGYAQERQRSGGRGGD